MSTILSMEEISTLDRQIEQLYDYKPIPENEVKALCDKVSQILNELTEVQNRRRRFFRRRVMCSQ